MAATISRNHRIGWRRAMVSTARSSITCCKLSIRVGGDDALAQHDNRADQRIDGFDRFMRSRGRPFPRPAGSVLQIAVERLGGVSEPI